MFDQDGQFSGRAFVHYDFPEEAAFALAHHNASPFVIDGQQLKLTTNDKMADMRRPSRWVLVEGAPNLFRKPLASIMSKFGTVHKVRRGAYTVVFNYLRNSSCVPPLGLYKSGRYVVEFTDIDSAVRAMEAHFLRPFTVEDRKLSLDFIAERMAQARGVWVGPKEDADASSE